VYAPQVHQAGRTRSDVYEISLAHEDGHRHGKPSFTTKTRGRDDEGVIKGRSDDRCRCADQDITPDERVVQSGSDQASP